MLSTEQNEYISEELVRGGQFLREGMMYSIRRLSVRSGRLLLGNPKFDEEFVRSIMQLCTRFTVLNDQDPLYAAIVAEASARPVNSEGDQRFFQSFWLSTAKDIIRREREGATMETDLALKVSISRVSDCLEEFAIRHQFDDQKFTVAPKPITVDGEKVQPISTCPAIGIVRGWSGAYTNARLMTAITHPELVQPTN